MEATRQVFELIKGGCYRLWDTDRSCKLLMTSLFLATGWKGDYLFPIMIARVALDMAGKLLFPAVPSFTTPRGHN